MINLRLRPLMEKFKEARAQYTNNYANLDFYANNEWVEFFERLFKENIDPFQYLYFIVHHLDNSERFERINYSNLIRSEKTIEKYLEYNKEINQKITLLVDLQRKNFFSLIEVYDEYRNAPIAAIDKTRELSAPAKIDLILLFWKSSKEPMSFVSETLQKYKAEALYLVQGLPVYLECCPRLRVWLSTELGKDDDKSTK